MAIIKKFRIKSFKKSDYKASEKISLVLNKDQIKFIGLQGIEGGTVGYNSPCYGNDNPFNPTNGGSNNQFTGF